MLYNFDNDIVVKKKLIKENYVMVVPPGISASIQPLLGSENHFHLCLYTSIT
jgi:hypothetical protein